MSSFLMVLTLSISLLAPINAYAATSSTTGCKSGGSFLGLPTWYKYLNQVPDGSGRCVVDFDPQKDIPKIIFALIEILTTLLGVVAVVMVVWGGFQYITSQGEPEATKNARNTIVNALIGIGIAISATAVVNLIANNLF